MAPSDLIHGDPETTRDAIMQATYQALCEHGYAELTIQRIGDEFTKSKSLLYHHYDGKDELLLEFLETMIDRFENEFQEDTHEAPRARLDGILDYGLAATLDEERAEFTRTMGELRAQAAHDDRYHQRVARLDESFRDHVAAVIRDGVAADAFAAVDPEQVADFVLVVLNGARLQRVTGGTEGDMNAAREEMRHYVRCRLEADE